MAFEEKHNRIMPPFFPPVAEKIDLEDLRYRSFTPIPHEVMEREEWPTGWLFRYRPRRG